MLFGINMSSIQAILDEQRVSEEAELLNVPVLEVIDLHYHAYSISCHSFSTIREQVSGIVIDVLVPSYRP